MQNTGCCPSYDERTREIDIFGKVLKVKNYVCSPDGINYARKPENLKIGMSICPTSFCPADCRFCIANGTKNDNRINLEKLEKILTELKQQERIFWISFTGGEPFYDIELLNEAVSMVFEIMGKSMEVSINTNGIGLSQIHKIQYLSYLDAVHVSRHHYNDGINDRIFGMKMPTATELKEAFYSVSYRDLFVINCMLQKDFIGTPEEVHKFLDFSIELGAQKVSFITVAPVNSYAIKQYVEYENVLKREDPSFLFTRGYKDYEFCRCDDGIYCSPKGKLIEFYGRATNTDKCNYCRGLTYGADNFLRSGFNGGIIR